MMSISLDEPCNQEPAWDEVLCLAAWKTLDCADEKGKGKNPVCLCLVGTFLLNGEAKIPLSYDDAYLMKMISQRDHRSGLVLEEACHEQQDHL